MKCWKIETKTFFSQVMARTSIFPVTLQYSRMLPSSAENIRVLCSKLHCSYQRETGKYWTYQSLIRN